MCSLITAEQVAEGSHISSPSEADVESDVEVEGHGLQSVSRWYISQKSDFLSFPFDNK